MINITSIVQAVITLIVAIVATVVVPYIKSKTSAQKQEDLAALVEIAVQAAEQIYTGPGRGAEKKTYVLEWLKNRNIDISSSEVDAMIEAAVYALKDAWK